MGELTRLNEVQSLDPERDHQAIVRLMSCYQFPWDMTRSLELALFRTFCVPRISALLDRTGEFHNRTQKRYDDTDLLISELIEWGYDSDRGRRALRRINQHHGRFDIANEDFLYVLSTFIFEPIRWNHRFGWRKMCDQERLGLFYFWLQVGRLMGIREIPKEYDQFERFNLEFERTHFRYADSNHRIGTSVLEMFSRWFPKPLRAPIRKAICSVMDDAMINGFGFARPSPPTRSLVTGALKLRARVIRWWPSRRLPRLRTAERHLTYPEGYNIDKLGPPAN